MTREPHSRYVQTKYQHEVYTLLPPRCSGQPRAGIQICIAIDHTTNERH